MNRSAPSAAPRLGLQHLERHLALVLEILGQVDGGHAALPKLALDAITIDQCRREPIGCRAHDFTLALSSSGASESDSRGPRISYGPRCVPSVRLMETGEDYMT